MTLEFEARRHLGDFSYGVAFEVDEELVVLFGHSGAGKSVTLRMVAGLVRPEAGRIVIDGRPVFDATSGVDVRPQERGVGYVVQDLALFPHLDVLGNVTFGAVGGRAQRERRASELLAMLGLQGFERRMPGSLSGGERQRVALARALARDVRLLLLDEPFSALDESLRRSMRSELLRLRRDLGLTVVFVTHDLREAYLLADRLVVMDNGRVLQSGPRDEVFRRPAGRRVAELTGVANILRGTVRGREPGCLLVDVAGITLRCASVTEGRIADGDAVDVAIRAERVIVRRGTPSEVPEPNVVEADLAEDQAYGANHVLRFRPVDVGPELEVDIAARPYEVLGITGSRSWALELPAADLHVMPREPR